MRWWQDENGKVRTAWWCSLCKGTEKHKAKCDSPSMTRPCSHCEFTGATETGSECSRCEGWGYQRKP